MKHHNIPCIYVTAHDLPTSEAVGPVFRKPVTDDQLLAAVATALASSPAI